MKTVIEDFTPSIINTTKQRASIFLRLACDAIESESNPTTPKKDGFLRRGVLKSVSGLHGKIQWGTNYAAVQEVGMRKGKPFKNYTTPGTGPHYAQNAVNKIVDDAPRIMKLAHLI